MTKPMSIFLASALATLFASAPARAQANPNPQPI